MGDGKLRPNILLVLTDDQGWPTLECYGGRLVPTPHLDRLADEGVRFTDAYVTSQCTPTRASLLTGQYTARHRLWHVLSWYGYPWARMTEPPFAENYSRATFTIANGLRSAGCAAPDTVIASGAFPRRESVASVQVARPAAWPRSSERG